MLRYKRGVDIGPQVVDLHQLFEEGCSRSSQHLLSSQAGSQEGVLNRSSTDVNSGQGVNSMKCLGAS